MEDTMEKNKGTSNYDLKSEAVETLVGAESENTPQYSQEELNKYRSRGKIKIPELVKVLFLKAWFAGAVCYFILWGLGVYLTSMIDMLFVLGFALGAVTDLLLNNVIRFIEKNPGDNDRWMMFPQKGMAALFLNVIYGFLVLFCVYMLYNLINYAIIGITGAEGTVPLGVEPVLFGVFCMGFDMLFIGIKHLCGNILRDAKNAAKGK